MGRGEFEEITDFYEIPYERYPRTFYPPYSIELIIVVVKGRKYVATDIIDCTPEITDYIKTGINIFLELFKECSIVLNDNFDYILNTKVIRLNWDILPKGEYPWEKQRERIMPLVEKASPKNRNIIKFRLETISKYKPDFVAIGLNGFDGYIVYGFKEKNIYIFESRLINNATYIFDRDWKDITMLTKKEILTDSLQKARIIHRKDSWEKEIEKLLK